MNPLHLANKSKAPHTFTPGPWAPRRTGPPRSILHVESAGESICHVYGPDINQSKPLENSVGELTAFGADMLRSEYNAKLIASAPDLLAALKLLLEDCKASIKDIGGCDHSVGICACELVRNCEQAEAAIRKATEL